MAFTTYEAEDAETNGQAIGPDRAFTTLAAEASGRRGVQLEGPGDHVTFTLAAPADALTVRYALPDSPDGKGIDARIGVFAGGRKVGELALTSRYSWHYGRYPFTNRPADGHPHHLFDETRLLLAQPLPAGTRVSLRIERPDAAAWRVIDLADFELAGPPAPRPAGSLSVLDFGADPTGAKRSAAAFDRAIAEGRRTGRAVWIDPGRYRIERHLTVDRVTLAGAGPWHSILFGKGVGVFGRKAPHGSTGVVLRGFAIIGEVTGRDDQAPLSAIGGAMSDSLIEDLFLQHTKVGLWFDGPMRGLTVRRLKITDQAADGLNFHRGVTDAAAEDLFVRNSGDDGLAAWSHRDENARITFRRNTVIAPTLANGIAVYGGRDITVEGNLVVDTVTEGGGLHLGARFDATPFAGRILLKDNTVLRGGVMDPNWRIGIGALWLYALDRSIEADIRIEDLDLVDSTHPAILFIGKSISGVAFDGIRIIGAGSHALDLRSPGSARFERVTASGLRGAAVRDCGSGFEIVRGEGNAGWDERAC